MVHSLCLVTYGVLKNKESQGLLLLLLALQLAYYVRWLCPSYLPSENEGNDPCKFVKLFEISNANIIHVQMIIIVSQSLPSVYKQ